MISKWEGADRRKHADDHDTLISLVQILNSHVTNFNDHILSDKKSFDKLENTVLKIERCIWIATGVIVAIHGLPSIANAVKILSSKTGG